MLWTPDNEFQFSVDNFGATFTDAGIGTNVPGNASANVKGANTQLLTGIAEDCYGIAIHFTGGNASTVIRRHLVDILIDPGAGVGGAGSSWSVLIPNLLVNSPAWLSAQMGCSFYFPIYIKAGTAIGARNQSLAAATVALRCAVFLYGKPSRPELVKVGSRVEAIGVVLASTNGTAVTPGTSALGAYSASLGTTSFDAWWWQLGIGSADTTMTANVYLFDVAVNATNKLLCLEQMAYNADTTETAAKSPYGHREPIRPVKSGEDVYVRGAAAVAPDTGMTAVVYALG